MLSVAELPDDPVLLKRAIAQRDQVIGQQESALALCDLHIEQIKQQHGAQLEQIKQEAAAARDAAIAQRQAELEQIKQEAAGRIEALTQQHKAEIDALLRRFYGPHSERFDPRQLLLFGLTVDTLEIDEKAVEEETGQKLGTRRVGKRHKHGRGILPAHLPRVRIEHDLTAEQKVSKDGRQLKKIGEVITEQLDFKPGGLHVLQNVQFKYVWVDADGKEELNSQIVLAEKPAQPIDKGLAGPGLLAHVAVGKYNDHLPLYRLEGIFARSGLEIARSTMCAWMLAVAILVKPLYELMGGRVRQSKVIHTDDTRVPVQHEGQCKSGRIWVYLGDESNPYDIYEYTPDRTRAGPSNWLKDYKGYLQADAYGGYDGIYATGVIEVACWAHARRKFFDARESDGRRSAQMLAMVRQLYAVEDQANERVEELLKSKPGATAAERHEIVRALRQEKSVPQLAKIKAWLLAEQQLVLPRSPMAGAIGYTLNQWEALCVYTTRGDLEIDNNAAERAVKRVAIGRKNWLFAGNDTAGQAAAVIYTLIASAQRHGLDPERYLTSVFAKIASTPMGELDQFLPDVWKKDLAAESAAGVATTPALASSRA
jgi:transposase